MMKMKSKQETIIKNINNQQIVISVIRRKRKNVTLQVTPNNISIISPPKVSLSYLEKLIVSKEKWLVQKINEYKNIEVFERTYTTGDVFLYLGDEYKLHIIKDDTQSKYDIYIKDDELVIISKNIDSKQIQKYLKQWYKEESEKIVNDRVNKLCKKHSILSQIKFTEIKVKEQKKRWGSCTSKGNIYINSKIAMLRIDVIDYIIVHELSHIVHFNHSKEFYEFVENILPEYKNQIKWLKDNALKVNI